MKICLVYKLEISRWSKLLSEQQQSRAIICGNLRWATENVRIEKIKRIKYERFHNEWNRN